MSRHAWSLIQIFSLLGSIPAVSGCSVRHGDFTVLSNKLVRTSDFDLSKADRERSIEGSDSAHLILFIPTGQPTLEGALDDTLRNGDGDVVTDAVVHSWWWWIPYLYGNFGWEVEGDVVRTRQ